MSLFSHHFFYNAGHRLTWKYLHSFSTVTCQCIDTSNLPMGGGGGGLVWVSEFFRCCQSWSLSRPGNLPPLPVNKLSLSTGDTKLSSPWAEWEGWFRVKKGSLSNGDAFNNFVLKTVTSSLEYSYFQNNILLSCFYRVSWLYFIVVFHQILFNECCWLLYRLPYRYGWYICMVPYSSWQKGIVNFLMYIFWAYWTVEYFCSIPVARRRYCI